MIIALFPNLSKEHTKEMALIIANRLLEKGAQIVVEDADATILRAIPLSKIDISTINLVISIGGDGTILRYAHLHREITAPVVGINMGGLGFMADIRVEEAVAFLDRLLTNDYQIYEHLMIEGKTNKGDQCFAINDIVVHRSTNPCLIDLAVHVGGKYLNTFSADGIIIATPCGSTAYSLAAGGPILAPSIEAVVITPISPHTLSNRPIVVNPEEEITIEYISEHEIAEISYDGITSFGLSTGDYLTINKSTQSFQLIGAEDHNYFSILREKLHWSGKIRSL